MTHQHYTGCHLHHFPCALERIRDLEKELEMYKTPLTLTHSAYVPCSGPGPTWAHCNDEPPSTLP